MYRAARDLIFLREPLAVVGIEPDDRDMDVFSAARLRDGAGVADDRGQADEARHAADGGEFDDLRRRLGPAVHIGTDATDGDLQAQPFDERADVVEHRLAAADADAQALGHGVDRAIPVVEQQDIIKSEEGVHPHAQIAVDPGGV